jgi:hypothetical protein
MLVTLATWVAGAIVGQRVFGLDAGAGFRLLLTGLVGAVLVHPLTAIAQWMVDDTVADRAVLRGEIS